MWTFNSFSSAQLSLQDEGCLLLGFLSYKVRGIEVVLPSEGARQQSHGACRQREVLTSLLQQRNVEAKHVLQPAVVPATKQLHQQHALNLS